MTLSISEQMNEIAAMAKAASRELAKLTTQEKNECLLAMADAIERESERIKAANDKDMELGAAAGLTSAMLDRLKLTDKRISAMATGLREVSALPDPVGKILDERVRPNGLKLRKVAVPIGVIVIIYESRPNVTADAAGLCFKSGNATILRGGKEAINSNTAIARIMIEAAKQRVPKFPENAIQVVQTTDRSAIKELLSLTQYVDLCIPRGGEGLIRAVAECSRVPVIKHYKGVCHVYVHTKADINMAEAIVMNAKCQRPAVCNAMECLIVDKNIAGVFLPRIANLLWEKNVELRADAESYKILLPISAGKKLVQAKDEDFYNEYNDYIMNIRVVVGVDEAIAHIAKYGSAHSDSIVTEDESAAIKFLNEVDSAAVYWNASTRFTDGGEFGMGAEIGISTDKIGARGPMGLDELTSYKWVGLGSGQLRT
ncbi:MAG: glutamate-5-semialdehyde dehydrogenase [Verrucomicrobiae bacterium]|nr:glutamate-5-semialdehyde dehydrogenase [Verrucomicrobiae bacterium]